MHDFNGSNDIILDQVLITPAVLQGKGDRAPAQIKVDAVQRIGASVVVIGWCSDDALSLSVYHGAQDLAATCLRYARPDVVRALGLGSDDRAGFAVLVDLAPDGPIDLRCHYGGQKYCIALTAFEPVASLTSPELIAEASESLVNMTVGAPDWAARLALLGPEQFKPDALSGFVDHAFMTDAGGMVAGWALASEGVQVWIEDDAGRAYDLDQAYRWWRADVAEAPVTIAQGGQETGFLRGLVASRGARSFRLGGCDSEGRLSVPETSVIRLRTEVASIAEALFGINTPRFDLVTRAHAVDLPLLSRIQRAQKVVQAKMTPKVRSYGTPPASPEISIIIPLYERYDMMELQLLEFAKDPDFKHRCEIIFVNDDPRNAQMLIGLAGPLHDIVNVPFKIVSAGDNRGFSGANNLGAKVARGETLIFMNSDVFPNQSGWANVLANTLVDHSEYGIIAPRLVFPDGSLQHAGMEPVWRDGFGLWTNRHPMMGFDVTCDPAETLQDAPLVSGACVALLADDFHAVGGWSTDYLIGDFEDSDLCLSLAEKGLKTGYLPTVSLTHLERQSMTLVGAATYRERVTLLNAALYNKRWHKVLREMRA